MPYPCSLQRAAMDRDAFDSRQKKQSPRMSCEEFIGLSNSRQPRRYIHFFMEFLGVFKSKTQQNSNFSFVQIFRKKKLPVSHKNVLGSQCADHITDGKPSLMMSRITINRVVCKKYVLSNLSYIFAIRSSPLPFRSAILVVEAWANMWPPMGFFGSAWKVIVAPGSDVIWLVINTATLNSTSTQSKSVQSND